MHECCAAVQMLPPVVSHRTAAATINVNAAGFANDAAPDPPSSNEDSSGPSVALIVAIVLGCLLATTLAVVTLGCAYWRRSSRSKHPKLPVRSGKSASAGSVVEAVGGRVLRSGSSIVAPSDEHCSSGSHRKVCGLFSGHFFIVFTAFCFPFVLP
jgi:hypothetical protein